jgi:hypothetical protein
MKADVIVLSIVAFFAFAVSQAHADQMGDLCAFLNTSDINQAGLNQKIANEHNPLKQNSLQQQLQ